MNLVFDESGNWGRSTERYFVIGGFVTDDLNRIRGVMRRALTDVRSEFPRLSTLLEIKAQNSPPIVKDYILRKLAKENMRIYYMVIDKNHVNCSLSGKKQNIFYNYQLGLIAQFIRTHNPFTEYNFYIDSQSIKVGSLNSFEDYIMIKLNFEIGKDTDVNVKYRNSEHYFEIQAADFICNALWTGENYTNTDYYSPLLRPAIAKRLTFPLSKFGK